jgi:fumarylpyruvate hydrolase
MTRANDSTDTAFAIPPGPLVTAEIHGESRLFPVHRIYCVARNYQALAQQLGSDARDPPVFFTKPVDALIGGDATIPYPSNTADFQHEVELVVVIGRGGSNISHDRAFEHIFGFAVGNDLTRRDRQIELAEKGKPWDLAKAFDRSAQMGPIYKVDPASVVDVPIWLDIDGARRQQGRTSEMIWAIPEVIAILSRSFELQAGDLIFTGTPAGVGAINPGQVLVGGVEGLGQITLRVEGGPEAQGR